MNHFNKISRSILGLLAIGVMITSCEDVIVLDPIESDTQLVIDAWIDNRNTTQTISLSQSRQFFDNTTPEPVTNANVTLTKNDGTIFIFNDNNQNGKYEWEPSTNETLGISGDQFSLEIDINGDLFTAETTMNRVPPVDSITQEFRDDEIFLDDGIYLEFFARDPQGTGDAYWIKAFKNGEFLNRASQLNIVFDAGFDSGSQLDGIIFIPPIREFINELDNDDIDTPWKPGETSKVEIHSLSIDAFNFLEIARDQINNGSNGIFSLPLANTRTNITNESGGLKPLGLFNVAAVSSLEIQVE